LKLNALGILFTLISSVLLLTLPRRLAVVPLLMAAAYMTRGQVLELGPAHFTVMRILVAVGFVRVILKGEYIANGVNAIDVMLVLCAIWLIGSGLYHASDALVFRAGVVWSELGCYFLFRTFLRSWEDVRSAFKACCIVLVPVAVLMLVEKSYEYNFFALLGGVNEIPTEREGRIRAMGPFAHPILAGTVGATCFPMALYLWKHHRLYAVSGLFASLGMVFASTSSGPVMMMVFTLFGLALWKVRDSIRLIRWIVAGLIIGLDIVMNDPVYFLMARIDIAGGSTGWFRARLIQSAIEHLDEWWLIGTDYTRHWMPSGIIANDQHTDMTNHFLQLGVWGGLPLMFFFIVALVFAFRAVGQALRSGRYTSIESQFLIWTLGATLFGQVMNALSISLFDQSIMFLYLILASIGTVYVRQNRRATSIDKSGKDFRREGSISA
jgi:hypothetical protein